MRGTDQGSWLKEVRGGRRGTRIEAAVCGKEGHYSTKERATTLVLSRPCLLQRWSIIRITPFSLEFSEFGSPLFPVLCPPLPSSCRLLWVHITGGHIF